MGKVSFYKELNKLSTADFYVQKTRPRTQTSQEKFEIERVISKRVRNGKVSDRHELSTEFIPMFHQQINVKLM